MTPEQYYNELIRRNVSPERAARLSGYSPDAGPRPLAQGAAQLDNLDGVEPQATHTMPDGEVMPGPAHNAPRSRPKATMMPPAEELPAPRQPASRARASAPQPAVDYHQIRDRPRGWSSRDGKFTLEGGVLEGITPEGHAVIRRPDGVVVRPHVSQLSGRDAAHVAGMSPPQMAGNFPLASPEQYRQAREETLAAVRGPDDSQYFNDLDAKTEEFRRQRREGLPVRDVTMDDVNAVRNARAAQEQSRTSRAEADRRRDEGQAKQARAEIEKYGKSAKDATPEQRANRGNRAISEDRMAADETSQVLQVRRLAKRMGIPESQAWRMYQDGLDGREVNKATRRDAMRGLVAGAQDARNARERAIEERLLNQRTLAGADPRKNAANAYTAMDDTGRQMALGRQFGVDPAVRQGMYESDQATRRGEIAADATVKAAETDAAARQHEADSRRATAADAAKAEAERLNKELEYKREELAHLQRQFEASNENEKEKIRLQILEAEKQTALLQQELRKAEAQVGLTESETRKNDATASAVDARARADQAEADGPAAEAAKADMATKFGALGMFQGRPAEDPEVALARSQVLQGDFSSPDVQNEIDAMLDRIAGANADWWVMDEARMPSIAGQRLRGETTRLFPRDMDADERVKAEHALRTLGVPDAQIRLYLDDYNRYRVNRNTDYGRSHRASRSARAEQ